MSMSLRDLFPELQLEDDVIAQIKGGRCPCKGSMSLPSATSKSGYRDCICKVRLRLKDMLGKEMEWLEGRLPKGPPILYQHYGKNLFYADRSKKSPEYARMRFLLQVKYALLREFYKHEVSLLSGGDTTHPLPKWAWIQSFNLVDLSMKRQKDENDICMLESLRNVPFLVMGIGFEVAGNKGYDMVFPSFVTSRSDRGLFTWFFTRSPEKDLLDIFNSSTVTWLKFQRRHEYK